MLVVGEVTLIVDGVVLIVGGVVLVVGDVVLVVVVCGVDRRWSGIDCSCLQCRSSVFVCFTVLHAGIISVTIREHCTERR